MGAVTAIIGAILATNVAPMVLDTAGPGAVVAREPLSPHAETVTSPAHAMNTATLNSCASGPSRAFTPPSFPRRCSALSNASVQAETMLRRERRGQILGTGCEWVESWSYRAKARKKGHLLAFREAL